LRNLDETFVNNLNKFPAGLKGPAGTPRWMTNNQPVSLDELAQSFALAWRLDSERILRCRQQECLAIRPSLSPSQRARNP